MTGESRPTASGANAAQEAPIFVRGLSRSGGTLMATILDAHSAVAMSYELYPGLLKPSPDELPLAELVRQLRSARATRATNIPRTRNMRVFVSRCGRSGIEPATLAGILAAAGENLDKEDARMSVIRTVCREKMRRENKTLWGAKCSNQYEAYLDAWPRARFVYIVRDGRDVLASQLGLGTFDKTPAKVATGWSQAYGRFCEFSRQPGVTAALVRYEALVENPAEEIDRLCQAIGLHFEPGMLEFHRNNLSIYRSNHLSLEQVSQPVTNSKVGRWRRELSAEQVRAFEQVAGDTLVQLGYTVG